MGKKKACAVEIKNNPNSFKGERARINRIVSIPTCLE